MNSQKLEKKNLAVICNKLVKALDESVGRNLADGILLSGGLDTSILAYLSSKRAKPVALTVAFRDAPAPDIKFAKLVANYLGLKHHIHYFDEDELYRAIRIVIKTLDSFDPMMVRNSVPIYVALKKAKDEGLNSIMSGDGGDELFAGYTFLFELGKEKLSLELKKLWDSMHFASVPLAEILGIEIRLPYLDPQFREMAMGIDPELKIREAMGRKWGKWILRKAFENFLPKEIIWRGKTHIELGCGTSVLPNFFGSKISDPQFDRKKGKYFDEDKVKIRDKEQLFYYEVYRAEVGVPFPTQEGKVCPYCSSSIPVTSSYCRRCGAYPI